MQRLDHWAKSMEEYVALINDILDELDELDDICASIDYDEDFMGKAVKLIPRPLEEGVKGFLNDIKFGNYEFGMAENGLIAPGFVAPTFGAIRINFLLRAAYSCAV